MNKLANIPGAAPLALRPKKAAIALDIGERKLWELTNKGEIPCVRIGACVLYPVDLLQAWLKEKATKKDATPSANGASAENANSTSKSIPASVESGGDA